MSNDQISSASRSRRHPDLSDEVMSRIAGERIRMRPRVYFVLATFLLLLAVIASVAVVSFCVNLVLWYWRIEHGFKPIWYQIFGWAPLFDRTPWIALLIAILGFWGSLIALRQFDVVHKTRWSTLVPLALIGIAVVGVIMYIADVNRAAMRTSPLRPLYHERRFDLIIDQLPLSRPLIPPPHEQNI